MPAVACTKTTTLRMATLTFTPADPIRHRDSLLALNGEYMTWTAIEIEKAYGLSVARILDMSVPAYVASAINKVCGDAPPNASFYLVEHEGTVAGMGGLRRVRTGVCELKRVYVRPTCRGKRIGASIVERALAERRRLVLAWNANWAHSAVRPRATPKDRCFPCSLPSRTCRLVATSAALALQK